MLDEEGICGEGEATPVPVAAVDVSYSLRLER